MSKKASLAVAAVCATALAGCSLAPEYKVPPTPSPEAFKEAGPWQLGVPADDARRDNWWETFKDTTLNRLETRVDSGNLDLAAAVARYDFAMAQLQETGAALYPNVTALGDLTHNRQSDNRPLRGSDQPDVYGAHTVGIGATYEVDVWGRVRDLVASGKAASEASAADVEFIRLSLHALLAADYFQLRGLDAEIKLLSDTANAYKRQLDLTNYRHDEGIVSGLDVSRAQTQLEEVRGQVANTRAQRALYEHAIASLLGEQVASFSLPAAASLVEQPDIPLGLPSTLLQRRPDIAAAERRVAAANAQIGVARAAFFPSITLGTVFGNQSTELAGLMTAPNTFWSIGPLALLTIFDAGRRDAIVAEATAKTNESAIRYRATVLQAFKEVEDNLALLREQREERRSIVAAAVAARHTYDLALNRYREGIVNYIEVVDADTAKLRSERLALDVDTRGLLASVGLIRALGGGWQRSSLASADSAGTVAAAADSGAK